METYFSHVVPIKLRLGAQINASQLHAADIHYCGE